MPICVAFFHLDVRRWTHLWWRGNSMQVVSVNIGGVLDVAIRGSPEPTSFGKNPVQGAVAVSFAGLKGNRLGTGRSLGLENHAVYLYPQDHYAHWESVLACGKLPLGSFGENLTVRGLDETMLRVGDELSIGTTVLRVIQPRIPCYKLAHFLRAPQDFPARFLRSGKVGVYCAVVAEGQVAVGDTVRLIKSDSQNATIAEFVRVSQFDTNDVQGLVALLESPGLIAGWRSRIEALLAKASDAGGGSPGWTGWHDLQCAERRAECDDVVSFFFADPTGAVLPACRPGQFLTLKLTPDAGAPIIRTYTISAALPNFAQPIRYRITVRREPGRAGVQSASAFLHDHAISGTSVQARMPTGGFTLDLAKNHPITFVSSGIGVTPMMAMLTGLVERGDDRPLRLMHGARSRRQHALREEQIALSKRLPSLGVRIHHSRPDTDERQGIDFHSRGRLTADDVLAEAPQDSVFYICGAGRFMADIAEGLVAKGIAPDRIHAEAFGPDSLMLKMPDEENCLPASKAWIRFEPSGVEAEWTPSDGPLLDFLERLSLTKEASCRSGICHTCAAELVSGTVVYPEGISPPEDAATVILCSARPASDLIIRI